MAKTQKLWSLWQSYNEISAESLTDSIKIKYGALSEAVCAQISADAVCFSRLGESDEHIYSHLIGLMGVYRRVVELAEQSEFSSANAGALIFGICEVLGSRLREFEDETEENGVNPISEEKKIIIGEALAKTRASIEKQKMNFTTGLRDGDSGKWDDHFEVILRGDFYEMYSFYREALRFCQVRLDDLHSRKSAHFYIELIEREWEELENIVNMQVLALEGENAADTVIPGIIDALREAAQQTKPVVEKMQERLNAPQKKSIQGRSYDEFESELLAALAAATPEPPQKKIFFAALDAEAMTLLNGIDIENKKATYTFQRMISAEILLAEEVTTVFEKTLKALPEIPDDGETKTEREILDGIRETIEIKISGLRESIQEFLKKGGDTLRLFSNEKSTAPDGECAAVFAAVRDAWLSNPPREEAIADFFENCKHGEIFAPFRERAEKQHALYTDIFEKSSFRFKKEILLYEICTYEEILTHSVSRLRDSRNPIVLTAALALDDTFRALEIILKKNNIEIIRPAVREQFNAREHEVLVAEKNDDFDKGEIIKIMTAGYRFKEQVVLRANVIAAR
jgi:hypothetical protein